MPIKKMQTRYLLCRPRGGLNDVFCQIIRCIEYAKREKRYLIIDIKREKFFSALSEFIVIKKGISFIRFCNNEEEIAKFEGLSVYPPHIHGCIGSYRSIHLDEIGYVDDKYLKKLTFDFSCSYSENLLVHEGCGGGTLSIYFFTYFALAENIVREINAIRTEFPENYSSIHVRNTDYQTDYLNAFKAISDQIKGKNILLCTDSIQVERYAKKEYPDVRWLSSATILDEFNGPLHYSINIDDDQQSLLLKSTLVDLLLMAYSDNVYIFKVKKYGFSGFSTLAHNLSRNKYILRSASGIEGRAFLAVNFDRFRLKLYFKKAKVCELKKYLFS